MTLKLAGIKQATASWFQDTDYRCPHCGRQQVIHGLQTDLGSVLLVARQCLSCSEVKIDATLTRFNASGPDVKTVLALYPPRQSRRPQQFQHAPTEVVAAYEEACRLYGLHVGAAGAYARRALELILDNAGYQAKSLAQSIEAAGKEADPDKRLPRRLLLKLDYVKEIGNFALHVRRDDELSIVKIDEDEVEACLEIVEELVAYLFEEPGRDHLRTVQLNAKLAAAGKKLIALPPGAGGEEVEV